MAFSELPSIESTNSSGFFIKKKPLFTALKKATYVPKMLQVRKVRPLRRRNRTDLKKAGYNLRSVEIGGPVRSSNVLAEPEYQAAAARSLMECAFARHSAAGRSRRVRRKHALAG